MDNILIIVSVLVPIISGVTQLVKQYFSNKYHGLIPLLIGLVLGPAYIIFAPDLSIYELLWAGGLAGLAAGGFYSVQNVRNKL